MTNGQAKELLADELRTLALNPTKQANTRVIEEAIAANQAAEQQALEALEVYRVLAGEDGALQMELDEAMEPDLGSSTGITGDMALEPEKQHEQEHQEQEESKSEGGEGGVSDMRLRSDVGRTRRGMRLRRPRKQSSWCSAMRST